MREPKQYRWKESLIKVRLSWPNSKSPKTPGYFPVGNRRTQVSLIFIVIIMFLKDQSCFLFLDPQDEVGPSISSSVVLCSFVILVYIVTFVLLFYLCPSSVRVVATFPATVLFPLLCSVRYRDYIVLTFPYSLDSPLYCASLSPRPKNVAINGYS